MPSLLPVFTVTVYVVPEPLTELTLAPLTPFWVTEKLLVDRPVMAAANVAVYCTELALVRLLVTAVSEMIAVFGAVTELEGIATFTVVALALVKATLPEV